MKTFKEINWGGNHWQTTGKNTQFRLAYEDSIIRLYFQPSADNDDWYHNFLILPSLCRYGISSLGSSIVWNSAKKKVLHDIQAMSKIFNCKDLEVYGYSHGGLIVYKAWPDLLKLKLNITGQIYASPKAWILINKKHFVGLRHIAHLGDIISHLPPFLYKHVGTQVRFGNGEISIKNHEPQVYRDSDL